MFEKRKNRHKEQNAELQSKLDKHVMDFDKAFADREAEKDSAKKITMLKALRVNIADAEYYIGNDVSSLSRQRAKHTPKSYLKRVGLVSACLPILTAPPVIFEADWTSLGSIDDKSRELKTKVDVNGFDTAIASYRERITELLKQTVENCDLNETSKSPHFPDALSCYEPLKTKFEAAALARAALGHKELVPDEAPEEKTEAPQKVLRAANSRSYSKAVI